MESIDFPLNQVKAMLLSMAADTTLDICVIQEFLEKLLIKKAIPCQELYSIFLIRCSPNNVGEVFRHVSRCSYHPIPDKIPLQRANYPAQQVLYAAIPAKGKDVSGDMTALLETTLDIVKNKSIQRCYLTLSRWQFNRPLKVFALPFSKRSAARNEDFKRMFKAYDKLLLDLCSSKGLNYEYLKGFLQFMSNVFCQRNRKKLHYRISAAFYNAVMNIGNRKHLGMDGLIFPSANSKAEGMNIVLKKEVVDDGSVYIDHVVTYVMQRNPTNHKSISYFDVSDGVCPDRDGKFAFSYLR